MHKYVSGEIQPDLAGAWVDNPYPNSRLECLDPVEFELLGQQFFFVRLIVQDIPLYGHLLSIHQKDKTNVISKFRPNKFLSSPNVGKQP